MSKSTQANRFGTIDRPSYISPDEEGPPREGMVRTSYVDPYSFETRYRWVDEALGAYTIEESWESLGMEGEIPNDAVLAFQWHMDHGLRNWVTDNVAPSDLYPEKDVSHIPDRSGDYCVGWTDLDRARIMVRNADDELNRNRKSPYEEGMDYWAYGKHT